MSNTLPMATEPSVNYNCDFHLITLPKEYQPSLLYADFVIELNTQTIHRNIASFLGIGYDTCANLLNNDFTHCQFPQNGFHGHLMRYHGITIEQLQLLWNNANFTHPNFRKYSSIIAKIIAEQILPLFNQVAHVPQVATTPVVQHETQTMTSLEIAELTGKLHKNVMVDIKKLINELGNELKIQPVKYRDKKGEMRDCYNLDREATLLLTSGYSAQLRLKIIRRLDELETGKFTPPQATPTALVVPQNLPDALRLAATLAEEKEVITHERDEAVRTKAMIGSKREATAMSKLGQATQEIKRLKNELERVNTVIYASKPTGRHQP